MTAGDTIVAVSSATGPAARMIVRVAGPGAFGLLRHLAPSAAAVAGGAERVTITFDGVTVPAWAYTSAAPHSYTGDDLVELHVPGSPLLCRMLVEHLIARDARPAEAGEFTARAFFAGRMDLAAAEGVALTLAATHEDERRAARQLMAGELSRRLERPLELLVEALALIESNIDFAEEDIAFIDTAEVRRRTSAAAAALGELSTNAARTGPSAGVAAFVLVGRPNAGKSTLLNALAGHERAVVSPTAGTTRDVLSADVALPRGLVRVLDVAGLETAGDDVVGRQTQERARRAVEEADFVVQVHDATNDETAWVGRPADVVVRTKADLLAAPPADPSDAAGGSGSLSRVRTGEGWGEGGSCGTHAIAPPPSPVHTQEREPPAGRPEHASNATSQGAEAIFVSVHAGTGLDVLRHRLDALAFGRPVGNDALALTARHAAAVGEAIAALGDAEEYADAAPELLAAHVRRAVDAVGRVLGRVTPDDVLGRVFATFCVGK